MAGRLPRNAWTASIGIRGRLASESVDGFDRNPQLGGAGVAAVTSVLFGVALRASLGGPPLMLGEMLAGLPMVALFGAVTAGATVRIAQRAQRRALESATSALEAEQEETLGLLGAEAV
jgi:hypothetical protein